MRIARSAALILCAMAIPALSPADADGQGVFSRLSTREVTVPEGTTLPIVMDTAVASNTSHVEQPVNCEVR